MPDLFNDEDAIYYRQQAEEELVKELRLVIDRWVIPVEEGVYLYTLPDYVFDIRRITWMGRQLNPYSGQEQIWSGSTPTRYSGGEPREYIYNYVGLKTIRFFPTPALSLSSSGDPWSGEVIREQCVMEFFRPPDFDNEYLRLPEWFRNQFTRNFMLMKLHQMDAQNYESKLVKRFAERYEADVDFLRDFKLRLHKAEVNIHNQDQNFYRQQPGRPCLPWQFGRIVE